MSNRKPVQGTPLEGTDTREALRNELRGVLTSVWQAGRDGDTLRNTDADVDRVLALAASPSPTSGCPNPFCDGAGNLDVSKRGDGRAVQYGGCQVGPHPSPAGGEREALINAICEEMRMRGWTRQSINGGRCVGILPDDLRAVLDALLPDAPTAGEGDTLRETFDVEPLSEAERQGAIRDALDRASGKLPAADEAAGEGSAE